MKKKRINKKSKYSGLSARQIVKRIERKAKRNSKKSAFSFPIDYKRY